MNRRDVKQTDANPREMADSFYSFSVGLLSSVLCDSFCRTMVVGKEGREVKAESR